MRASRWVTLGLLLTGCSRSFTAPPATGQVPPTQLVGRVVMDQAGTAIAAPAAGAYVELSNSNLSTRTNSDGRFALGPMPSRSGLLSLKYSSKNNGTYDLQRLLDISTLAPGDTGNIEAGDLILGANGAIRGRAFLGGSANPATGNSGIVVYVPGTPIETHAADNGLYVLDQVPAGAGAVAAIASGYDVAGLSGLNLQAGQVLNVADMELSASASTASAAANGKAQLIGNGSSSGIQVTLNAVGSSGPPTATATTESDGTYNFSNIPAGLYNISASGNGLATAYVYNVLLPAGADTNLGTIYLAPGQSQGTGTLSPVDSGLPFSVLPPIAACADAGTVVGGTVGTLDASPSQDPNGLPLSYQWVQTQGTTVQLNPDTTPPIPASPYAVKPTFLAPLADTLLMFQLTVYNSVGLSAQTTCQVPVYDVPVASLPQQVVVAPGQLVTLSGAASYDPDPEQALSYAWTVLWPPDAGPPPITLAYDAGPAAVTFVAPTQVGIQSNVQLIVTNGHGLSSAPARSTITVSGGNFPPTVDGGPDLNLDWGAQAALNPDAISLDGTTLTYGAWTLTNTQCGSLGTTTDGGIAIYLAPQKNCDTSASMTVYDVGGYQATATVGLHVRDQQPVQATNTTFYSGGTTGSGSGAYAFGPVSVQFRRPINTGSLDGGFTITGGGSAVPGDTSYNPTTLELDFVPRLPFPPGVSIQVSLDGVISQNGLGMQDGGLSFSFTALPPTLQALNYPFPAGYAPFGPLGGITEGPEGDWFDYTECAGCNDEYLAKAGAVQYATTEGVSLNSPDYISGNAGQIETDLLRVDPLSTYSSGSAWFSRVDNWAYNQDSVCIAGLNGGVAQILTRVTDVVGNPIHMGVATPDITDQEFYRFAFSPGTDCRVTQYATATLQGSASVMVGTIDWVTADAGRPTLDMNALCNTGNFTVECPIDAGMYYCPEHGTCYSNSEQGNGYLNCDCATGYAYLDCTNTPCAGDGSNCSYPEGSAVWYCGAEGPANDGIPFDTGRSAVNAFYCPSCMGAVDPVASFPVPASAWLQLPSPSGITTDTLSAVTMDATGGDPAMAWIDETRGGVLQAAVLDWTGGTGGTPAWTHLTNASGSTALNAAGSTASYPTARWIGSDLWVAYYLAQGASSLIDVMVFPNGQNPGHSLGGPALGGGVPITQRLRLAAVQDTGWLSWDEPSSTVTYQPHLAWYDPRTSAWEVPAGAGNLGELPLDPTCEADRANVSPRWLGAGLVASYVENCVTAPSSGASPVGLVQVR
ncbi:MAG: carboxypeptidase regulatory-like domain-containing protein [Deltaproteobacteria bacterium]|nr:carboxypeptidase regulatory-like domain-containing protein [Deltaproteobacteria bacterium]